LPRAAFSLTTSARKRDVVQQALHKGIKSRSHVLALFAGLRSWIWLARLLDMQSTVGGSTPGGRKNLEVESRSVQRWGIFWSSSFDRVAPPTSVTLCGQLIGQS